MAVLNASGGIKGLHLVIEIVARHRQSPFEPASMLAEGARKGNPVTWWTRKLSLGADILNLIRAISFLHRERRHHGVVEQAED